MIFGTLRDRYCDRNHSNDSRIWGFLPKKNVIGKVALRFFSFGDRLGAITTSK